jgi:hypothetical protein
MKRWLDPAWYRYLRWRLGPEGRFALGVILLALLGLGGFLSLRALARSAPPETQSYVALTTTVTKLVRVKEHGRVVVKRVPVVGQIYAKPVTIRQAKTIRTAEGTRFVTRPVVRYQPVYRREVVTIRGKPVRVNRIVTDTRMLTNTQLLTVTNTVIRQVTNQQTSTVVRGRTVSETQTVNQTVTLIRTQTSPPETVTIGPTRPVKTVTVTVTVTTTVPATVTATTR